MKISLTKVGYFKAKSTPFQVLNLDGTLFYKSTEKSKGFFSLPKGEYLLDFPFKKVGNFRTLKQLPKYERCIPRPRKFKFILKENPNKCSIFLEKGVIIFDKDLWESLSNLQRKFVLLHEYGHYYYKSEVKCDIFAKHHLLKLGYNKSQIAAIDFHILGNSEHSISRKLESFNAIKNY